MGPLLVSSGDIVERYEAEQKNRSFNGAAAGEQRRQQAQGYDKQISMLLQWGRCW